MISVWHTQRLAEGLLAFLTHAAECETCRNIEPAAWPRGCRWYWQDELPNLRRLLGGAHMELEDIEKALNGGGV